MSRWVCSCSARRTSPDPCCDMCDASQNDPDTGWGGFTDHHLQKHFNSESDRNEYLKYDQTDDEYGSETTG